LKHPEWFDSEGDGTIVPTRHDDRFFFLAAFFVAVFFATAFFTAVFFPAAFLVADVFLTALPFFFGFPSRCSALLIVSRIVFAIATLSQEGTLCVLLRSREQAISTTPGKNDARAAFFFEYRSAPFQHARKHKFLNRRSRRTLRGTSPPETGIRDGNWLLRSWRASVHLFATQTISVDGAL
jgi:hypothetical protein